MRRVKSLVFLVVLAMMVFGLAATASADTFSDVASSPAAGDIGKIAALGIVNGYPDGTFKPDGKITRAEFAKMAVITAGLGDVAEGYASVSSSFSDVKTSDWFIGYVNVAVAQGYVKGYPNGTFQPNAEITQQEVITVLLRLLGYNDNLPGEWPFDYLAKAQKLGTTDNIKLTAALAATRGDVARLISSTLDENVVEYDAEKNRFDEKQVSGASVTLLADNFKDGTVIEDAVITNYNAKDNKVKLVYTTWNSTFTSKTDGQEIELDPTGYTVQGAATFLQTLDRMVDIVTVTRDDKTYARYVEVKNYGLKTDDEITIKTNTAGDNADTVKMGDISYNVVGAPVNALVSFAGVTANTEYKLDAADLYKITLNDDGKVVRIKATRWGQAAIVDSVDESGKIVRFKEKGTEVKGNKVVDDTLYAVSSLKFDATRYDLDDYENNYYIVKNGKPATLADLKENDMVFNYARGVTLWIEAGDKVVEGKLTSYEDDGTVVKKVTVGDKTYTLAEGAKYDTKGGEDLDKDATNINNVDGDLLDVNVKLYLNPIGDVAAISTDEEAESNKVYGIVVEVLRDVGTTDGVKDYIKLLKADGVTATYQINSDSSTAAKAFRDSFASNTPNVDRFAWITLQSDGSVDDLSAPTMTMANATDVESGRILQGTWKIVASEVKVFNLTNPDTDEYADVENYSDVYDYIDDGGTPNIFMYSKDNDGVYDYIVLASGTSVGSDDFYMVMKKAVNSDGTYVVINRNGTSVTKNVKSGATVTGGTLTGVGEFDVVQIKFSADKISDIDFTYGWNYTGSLSSVSEKVYDIDKSGMKIAIGSDSTWYVVDQDTIIYDVDEDDPTVMTLDDVAKDDLVKFYAKDGAIKWMVVNN